MYKYFVGILLSTGISVSAQAKINCLMGDIRNIDDILKFKRQLTETYNSLWAEIDNKCIAEYQKQKLEYQNKLAALGNGADELGYEISQAQFLDECRNDASNRKDYENCLDNIEMQLQSILTEQRILRQLKRQRTRRPVSPR